jgi:hypothetical protein
MAEDVTRIEIGFEGGLIAGFRLTEAEWDKLSKALSSAAGMVGVTADDGTDVWVDTSKVAYVKREPRVSRVGF